MAGMFMIGLTAFGAVAIDASRIFTHRAEIQTIADAAALAGAIQMLRGDSSEASDTATAYATRNGYRPTADSAMSDRLVVATGVWNTSSHSFVAGGSPVDAISVTLDRRVNYILAQMFGTTGLRITASATAWSSAPVSGSSDCVKPLMFPYEYVRDLANSPSAEPTADDLRRIRELTESERTRAFEFGESGSSTDGRYFAVDLPPLDAPDGVPIEEAQGTYEEYVAQCKTTRVNVGDWLRLEDRNPRRSATVNGMRELCQLSVASGGLGGTFTDGTCVVGGQATGIPIKVGFWDGAPTFGGAFPVKSLGSFVVTNISTHYDPLIEQPRATITGYLRVANDFGPVSDAPSTLRRAVIVE